MISHASLKAAGLSFNFGNVTTSSDVSLQMYASTYCPTSGGLIQFSCHQNASHLVYQTANKTIDLIDKFGVN